MFSLKIITHSLTKEELIETLDLIKRHIENNEPIPQDHTLQTILWDTEKGSYV